MKNQTEIPRGASEGALLGCQAAEGGFTKSMTHELRTRLNVIIGACQLLTRDQKPSLSALQQDTVDRMERNARALLESVNHLLECLRTGKFE